MNPESTPSDTLILQLVTLIKDTKDFAAAQLPDVVNQLILQKWIGIGCGIIIPLVFGIVLLLTARDQQKKYIEDNEDYRLAICVPGYVGAALALVPILCHIHEALCLYFTPKAFILGELMKMVHAK